MIWEDQVLDLGVVVEDSLGDPLVEDAVVPSTPHLELSILELFELLVVLLKLLFLLEKLSFQRGWLRLLLAFLMLTVPVVRFDLRASLQRLSLSLLVDLFELVQLLWLLRNNGERLLKLFFLYSVLLFHASQILGHGDLPRVLCVNDHPPVLLEGLDVRDVLLFDLLEVVSVLCENESQILLLVVNYHSYQLDHVEVHLLARLNHSLLHVLLPLLS